jgi:alkylation response protein AidB-like acyl-CoA dehydrogenase
VAFDLTPDPSQQAVAELFNRFFTRESPPAVVREAEPSGFSPVLWDKLRELGAAGMGASQEQGGGGASMIEMGLVAEAAGRALAPVPVVDHLAVSRLGSSPELVDGTQIGALALRPAVDGVWRLVPAGAVADVVVGLEGDDLVRVTGTPPRVGPLNHADAPLADRSTSGDRQVIGDRRMFERGLAEWKVLQASQLVGLATRALEIVTEYVTERQQFGRPVGGFQAVQHGLADCVAPIEGSRLLATKAAWAVDEGLEGHIDVEHDDIEDPAVLATMAFVFAAETAGVVTKKAVQYHGSYGVSVEYDIQLYYRRARGWPLVVGSPGAQHQHLADLIWPKGA